MIAVEQAAADPVTQLVVSTAALVGLVVVTIIAEMTRRRARKVDESLGEPQPKFDSATIAEHVANTDANVRLLADSVRMVDTLVRSNQELTIGRIDHLDATIDAARDVLAKRGLVIDELVQSRRDQGERLGALEEDMSIVKHDLSRLADAAGKD